MRTCKAQSVSEVPLDAAVQRSVQERMDLSALEGDAAGLLSSGLALGFEAEAQGVCEVDRMGLQAQVIDISTKAAGTLTITQQAATLEQLLPSELSPCDVVRARRQLRVRRRASRQSGETEGEEEEEKEEEEEEEKEETKETVE